jgi:hypothetical protein
MTTFQEGQTIKVTDCNSWYFGHEAIVQQVWWDALYVAVPSTTGNAKILFSVKKIHAEPQNVVEA